MKENTSENMHIWKQVEVTPKAWLKDANIGGNKIKAINPQKQLKQATEIFGPYGATWGLKDFDLKLIELEQTVKFWLLTGTFFYPNGSFPVSNTIKFCYTSAKGKYIADDEATKKLETNTISKSLSRLGFASDVFEGNHDKAGYSKMVDFINELTPAEIKAAKKLISKQTTINGLARVWNSKTHWHSIEELVELQKETLHTLQELAQ